MNKFSSGGRGDHSAPPDRRTAVQLMRVVRLMNLVRLVRVVKLVKRVRLLRVVKLVVKLPKRRRRSRE